MLGDPLAAVTSRTFSVLSQLRGKRIVHPHGVGCKGVLTPAGGPPYSFGTERRRVIARLSRSVGLPESLRDPCGIGLRILDLHGMGAHQDLLLVSSSRVPGGRHLLLPARDFASSHYSTLLPYRLGGGLVVFGASPLDSGDQRATLSELAGRDHAGLVFGITVASPWGPWREIATLELGGRIPDQEAEALRLDPSNTGGELELAGMINRLRRPAYRGSQDGRAFIPPDLPRRPA